MTPTVHINQLIIYPVKSLRGFAVDSWVATSRGLEYDRHWMLVTDTGRFVSQRQLTRMALIDTQIHSDSLVLSADGCGSVAIPLAAEQHGETFTAQVWRDCCEVTASSESASEWLNRVLRPPRPLRLVRMAPGFSRQHVDPQRFGPQTHTHFADAAPYLIANNASLQRLNQKLTFDGINAVDIRRFRPNIVLDGLNPFTEHDCHELRHDASGARFRLIDHCERCIVTTIDPDTASRSPDNEPYETLRRLNPVPGKDAAAFGVNATLESAQSITLQCGDPLAR